MPIVRTIRRIQAEEDVSEIQALIWSRIQEKLRAEGRSQNGHDGTRRQQTHAREAATTPQDGTAAEASVGSGSTLEEEDEPETQHKSAAVIRIADLFDLVVRMDVPFIARQIQRCGVPSSDVADLTQEVLLAVLSSRRYYDPPRGARRTWLHRVAFFRSMAYRGSARYRREELEGLHPGEAHGPVAKGDPEKNAIANEERQLVWDSIKRIPLYRRVVLIAYEIEEWTMDEIAQALGIPKSTGWARLQRAREELRRAVLRWLRVRKALASR